MTASDESEQQSSRNSEAKKELYAVTHCAFKTEYVAASSQEEAKSAAAGGFSTGDYAYGDPLGCFHLGPVRNLSEVPQVGEITIERLLKAESAVALGPATNTDALPRRDITRVRNKLERPANENKVRKS